MHQVDNRWTGDALASPVLRVAKCSKSFGRKPAIVDVSLDILPGHTHGLLGANGAGKSTLIHGIVGIEDLDSGKIEISSHPHWTPEAKRRIGFVPDELPLPDSLSGREFLDLCRRLQPDTDLAWREFIIDLIGIGDDLGKFIGELSHGMKKKLQVVGATAHQPPLLILDEPFRGLDADAFINVLAVLESHREQGGAVLLATHDLALAQEECCSVSILSQARVAATGSPSELIDAHDADNLAEVFLTLTGLAAHRRTAVEKLRTRRASSKEKPS